MSKRFLMVLVAFLTIGVQAFAQTAVSGKVVDPQGEAIVGAGVQIKGTTNGTVTDLDGAFKLAGVNSNTILVVSSIGYKAVEITVGSQKTIHVVLAEDAELLDDVVVVAYGTAKKKDLTGSVTAVDGNTIAVQAQSTISRALEGSVPGLQISALDGQPGLDAGIRLRGVGSASQNKSNALVVIDGVPQDLNSDISPLATINPSDIASITVLKDAASAALYGSRGANGVILVNTKNGQKGKTKITFEARMGINAIGSQAEIDKIGTKNPADMYEYTWLAIKNKADQMGIANSGEFASQHLFDFVGKSDSFERNKLKNYMLYDVPGMTFIQTGEKGTFTESATLSGAYLVNPDGKLNPDAKLLYSGGEYEDVLTTPRFRQEYKMTASGASEKMDYHFSLGYLNDPSYVQWSKFERLSARAKVNAQITDWLKAGVNFAYSNRNTMSQPTRYGRNPGGHDQNAFRWINYVSPLETFYARNLDGSIMTDANGGKVVHYGKSADSYFGTNGLPVTMTQSKVGPTGSMEYNLLEFMGQAEDSNKSNDFNMKGYLEASFLKYFKFTANISYDIYDQVRTRFMDAESASPLIGDYSTMTKDKRSYKYLDSQQLLNYNQDLGDHHIDAMLGHEYYQYDYDYIKRSGSYGLIHNSQNWNNFPTFVSATVWGSSGSGADKSAMESYLAQANYVYANKYYLSASARRDGSSKFRYNETRWGNFWSVGGGWKISGEEFMASTKNWLDFLKVRASYGLLGNEQGIGLYSGYSIWSWSGAKWENAAQFGKPTEFTLSGGKWVNDKITWENIYTFDAGVDFTMFGGKLSGTLDFYNRQTVNSLFATPVSYAAAGQTSLDKNVMGLRNYGMEIELSYNIIRTKDIDFSISTNGTSYRTIVTSVPEGTGSESLNGCWVGAADAWSLAGQTSASTGGEMLRGIGMDYYNMYMYKYAGVAGNPGISEWYNGGQKVTDQLGSALYWHTVTDKDLTAGKYAGHAAGDIVNVVDYASADKYEMGSAIPAWIGGLSLDFRYKNFDASVQFAYQIGGKFYSVEYGNGLYRGSARVGGAVSAELIGNTWTKENPNAKFPMVVYGGGYVDGATIGSWAYTDMALFDASYLSLKNITIGYTLPKKVLDRAKISAVRVFASADNALMLFGHTGVDPRWGIAGGMNVGAYAYPYLSSYNLGVNITL